jgi:hypothetical protein
MRPLLKAAVALVIIRTRLPSVLFAVMSFIGVAQCRAEGYDFCTSDSLQVDLGTVTFCIPNSDELYRPTIDKFMGLHFPSLAFVGETRVPVDRYYDGTGRPPIDGTYVRISARHPRLGGQRDAKRQAAVLQGLTEFVHAHPSDAIFRGGEGTTALRHVDDATIVARTQFIEYTIMVSETWMRLDPSGQVDHTMGCEYLPLRDALIRCVSSFLIGDTAVEMKLESRSPGQSFRLSQRIRSKIESLVVK